ncbi:MAG: IclR family transcriptional regulator [Methylobacteriaceae bacterium]|nr:IclR family transcriptional regulator [Methylobacteriaceae bacterium]
MDTISATLKPLVLLERIAAMPQPPSLSELALGTRLPKPTLHRWLASLEDARLLQRTPDGKRYEIAQRASELALSIMSNPQTARVRHDILQGVAAKIGEACNLTVLQGTQVVYIDRVESMWPLRIMFQPGSKVPAYCSASGKLFLALMPPARRKPVFGNLTLERFTEHTLTERELLEQEFGLIRKQGYALDREEYLSGLICLAVPIFYGTGRSRSCAAALAVQAPVTRMSCEDMIARLPELQAAAQSIGATFAR